jgi:hypothetical protein
MLSVFTQPLASARGGINWTRSMLIRPRRPARRTDTNRKEHMPTCDSCHVAAIAVVHSASAVRDLGFAGAVSTAAASALGIGYKRGLFDAPVARSAASVSDAGERKRAAIEIPTASGDRP